MMNKDPFRPEFKNVPEPIFHIILLMVIYSVFGAGILLYVLLGGF